MSSTPELLATLRSVLAYAERGGAPRELLEAAAGELVDVLLERDPRAELAARVARARAAGCSVGALQERFGASRATIYRLLKLSHARETDSRETPRVVSKRPSHA